MDFEYNGHLLEEDRINLVANEIVTQYPSVSLDKAKEAAMLEGKISEKKSTSDELNRLYNIMLVNSDNKEIVELIYNDYLEVLHNNIDENIDIYMNLATEINDYLHNDSDFPFISDYQ